MQKTIDTSIIIDSKILAYGNIVIEFTGDDITEEIAVAGIQAMEEYLASYKKAVGMDEAS